MSASIRTSRVDIIWNYIGTIVSMASGFALLPLLMRFLTSDELGLWYVFVAVANLTMLFEFGFNPTFARNIVYVVSGARRLSAEGCDDSSIEEGIDWHLLRTVVTATRCVFAVISIVALIGLVTVGTAYVSAVTSDMGGASRWISWAIFCVSIFVNLYFLYTTTVLRGYGDIAGENRARTFSKLVQLVTSGVFLVLNAGIVGASLGYLLGALSLRLFASVQLRAHDDMQRGMRADKSKLTFLEIRAVLGAVSHIAWRDGFVQLAAYASTQGMSIVSSLTLGLAETGTYSVLLQLGNAVYNFASAYPKSFYPSFQAAFASHEATRQRSIVAKGVSAYWALFCFGVFGVVVVIMPLLPIFKPDFTPDIALFLAVCFYLGLWNQHSIFCNYIIGMNEIPYMRGYVIAAFIGLPLSYVLSGPLGLGPWGLVLGQALSQAVYNNWKWPRYLAGKIGTTYVGLLKLGCSQWVDSLRSKSRREGMR